MNQLFATWTAMEARQKVVAILATIAMVLALIGLVRRGQRTHDDTSLCGSGPGDLG